MLKTFGLFFLLGLMVSCASYHNERSISSWDPEKSAEHRFPRPQYEPRNR
jgi:hypothetical protein